MENICKRRKDESKNDTAKAFKRIKPICEEKSRESDFNSIDSLAMSVIFSYLDVRSLYRVAFSSKFLSNLVTHHHVVRSGVISGGHAQKTLSELIPLLETRSIYVPSPLRLLRLVNGKYCEKHIERCAKDDFAKVSHIRPGYGLFLCWDCLTKITRPVSRKHKMLQCSRTARAEYSEKAYVLNYPFTDSAGEAAGCIVSYSNYSTIKRTPRRTSSTSTSIIDQYLSDLEADGKNPYMGKEVEIAQQYKSALILKNNRDEVRNRETTSRRHAALAVRIAKTKKLVSFVKSCFDKDEVCTSLMDCQYANENDSPLVKKSQPCGIFKCPLVHEKMALFVTSPSRGTKKKMKDIAIELIDDFRFIQSTYEESISSLSLETPMEAAIKSNLEENYTVERFFKKLDSNAIQLIRCGRFLEAVGRVL